MILKFLKAVSNLSFIFLIVNFFLCLTGYAPVNEYIFIWMIIFSINLYFEKYPGTYYKILLAVILMLPVIFIISNNEKIIVIIIFSVMFYLYKRNKNKLSYGDTAEEFKKSFFVILGIVIISGINFSSININKFIIPYTIFYLIFTVLLLRYLRNYEYNAVNEKLNKINTVYSIIVMVTAVISALESVRHSILSIILFIYRSIMSVFIYIFSMIFLLIYNLFKNIHLKGINPDIFKVDIKKSKLADADYGGKDFALSNPLLYKIIIILINIILIMLVIYIIIRILDKKSKAVKISEKCEETKEFIFSEKHSKKIKDRFVFGDYPSQIKYYYRKLMKDMISKGINLNKSDTTMDIHLKSEQVFNNSRLWKIREIYIKTRYGNKTCTKDDVKEFRNLYKNRKI